MRPAGASLANLESPIPILRRCVERDRRREQERRLELHLGGELIEQPAFEGREAAGF